MCAIQRRWHGPHSSSMCLASMCSVSSVVVINRFCRSQSSRPASAELDRTHCSRILTLGARRIPKVRHGHRMTDSTKPIAITVSAMSPVDALSSSPAVEIGLHSGRAPLQPGCQAAAQECEPRSNGYRWTQGLLLRISPMIGQKPRPRLIASRRRRPGHRKAWGSGSKKRVPVQCESRSKLVDAHGVGAVIHFDGTVRRHTSS